MLNYVKETQYLLEKIFHIMCFANEDALELSGVKDNCAFLVEGTWLVTYKGETKVGTFMPFQKLDDAQKALIYAVHIHKVLSAKEIADRLLSQETYTKSEALMLIANVSCVSLSQTLVDLLWDKYDMGEI